MPNPAISLGGEPLPFMQDPYSEVQEDDEDDPDQAEILEKMVEAVPPT